MSHKYELDYIEVGCLATYVNEKTGEEVDVAIEEKIATECDWRPLYICRDYKTDYFFIASGHQLENPYIWE